MTPSPSRAPPPPTSSSLVKPSFASEASNGSETSSLSVSSGLMERGIGGAATPDEVSSHFGRVAVLTKGLEWCIWALKAQCEGQIDPDDICVHLVGHAIYRIANVGFPTFKWTKSGNRVVSMRERP